MFKPQEVKPEKAGKIVVIICLAFMVIFTVSMLIAKIPPVNSPESQKQNVKTELIGKAKNIYFQMRATGVDMNSGPCLTEELSPDWVLDIAHEPRESIDDLPENQCARYLSGQAEHIIELNINGELIKME